MLYIGPWVGLPGLFVYLFICHNRPQASPLKAEVRRSQVSQSGGGSARVSARTSLISLYFHFV